MRTLSMPRSPVLPLLIAAVVLVSLPGCQPERAPTDRLDVADTQTGTETATQTAPPPAEEFPEEVIVLVEVSGNSFRARPKKAVLRDRSQTITWVALDPDVAIEIVWDASLPNAPEKPCPSQARVCGGKSIDRPNGRYPYAIRGSKGGAALNQLDPDVIILY